MFFFLLVNNRIVFWGKAIWSLLSVLFYLDCCQWIVTFTQGQRCVQSVVIINSCSYTHVCFLSSSMAALWLQSLSVLLLMVISSPGSQAMAPPQHLCGSHLVDALYLVCGDRGFFYNPKRDVDSLMGETGQLE